MLGTCKMIAARSQDPRGPTVAGVADKTLIGNTKLLGFAVVPEDGGRQGPFEEDTSSIRLW